MIFDEVGAGIDVALMTRMQTASSGRSSGDTRWDRLQELLTSLKPGERITVGSISARTGLGLESVNTVLEALTRAELFAQIDPATFVRDSLLKF